jgi:hypothetical protein
LYDRNSEIKLSTKLEPEIARLCSARNHSVFGEYITAILQRRGCPDTPRERPQALTARNNNVIKARHITRQKV